MFREFQTVVYKKQSVILPQLGKTLNVRGLTVGEKMRIQASSVTPSEIQPTINSICWELIEEKNQYKSYDEFTKGITLVDREAILFGILQASSNDEKEISASCEGCQQDSTLKVSLSSMLQMEMYPYTEAIINQYKIVKTEQPEVDEEMEQVINSIEDGIEFVEDDDDDGEDYKKPAIIIDPKKKETNKEKELERLSILEKRIAHPIPGTGVICFIKQPTLHDDDSVMKQTPLSDFKRVAVIQKTLIIDRFEEYKDNKLVQTVNDRMDIIAAYKSLPSDVQDDIEKKYNDEFGKYGISLKSTWTCPKCGKEGNNVHLDVAQTFFYESIGKF